MINIQKNISLTSFTTFKIGGPAKFFCEVSSEEDILEAVKYAKSNDLKVFIMGGGSNILISDDGFWGLVIRLVDASCKIQNTSLECGAGLSLSKAINLAKENSLSGLEWAAGIPGTIGGAVRGNAGAYDANIGDSIEKIKVVVIASEARQSYFGKDDIRNLELENNECKFGYRNSIFKNNPNFIIISCTLGLKKGDKAEIEAKIKKIREDRAGKNPKFSSAGSFFQNPEVKNAELIKKFEKDTGNKIKNGRIPAGWLIAEVGLLGKTIGEVAVSEEHGNFVINKGGAKAQDVVILASLIKQKVRDELGIELKEEIQYVGF
jgi:UDP-N-acetylmuramate dehydrogenase